ncbi:hypothetical protein Tco_0877912 [Tanacetum coccineum]|uniref:Uncharacterized protein n=1 Tax=Tanacetum coccineum TaxID=301880 RepID=A0ABQ5BWH0_9ASTR
MDSLIMVDKHLDTIPETKSDEFIKSSVENLVQNPSESEDECECDMLDCDDSQTTNFSTFSNPLFDDSTFSDDESSHEEVIHEISFKTHSNPLFNLNEEIIYSEFNPIHNEDLNSTPKNDRFDTESYLPESLINRDTLMASSPKIDSLFDEFAGELITIPLRIWVFNSLVHSLRVLSSLRRSCSRMASTAAKPCQGDSSEFYLITEKCEHTGPKVTTSQEDNTPQQVMAAPIISISSDVSVKSMGSSFSRVILIGFIFVEVPVALELGAAAGVSPAGVIELDTHSSSEADPLESSPPPVYVASMVSHFLCSNDSESDTKMPGRLISPIPHDAMLTRWRSSVASRSSSPTTSTPEILTAPILPCTICYSILIRPEEDIPIGRLYHTHPGGPCRALTTRKSIRPLPSHRLALRYTSHHLDHFTSGSSSSHSSSDHSSSGHFISGHSLSGHTSPDTTIADSSTPQRFVHPPLARISQCSEAYLRWRSAPLSSMYPPTTSESSAGDSSSESSDGPSC